MEVMENMRHGVRFYADFENPNIFIAKNPKWPINWISKFFAKSDFISFLQDNGIDFVYGTTQHNCILDEEIVKIHGDPTKNHHDWIIAEHMNQKFLCHVLCFLYIREIDEPIKFTCGDVAEPGEYAVCHFVDQDVFRDEIPQAFMYGHGNFPSYRTDGNCALIRGWAKFTNHINENAIPRRKPRPTLIMISVSKIVSTCIGIEDSLNDIPHSYIFLPPSKEWSQIFNQRMKELMELEGEFFWNITKKQMKKPKINLMLMMKKIKNNYNYKNVISVNALFSIILHCHFRYHLWCFYFFCRIVTCESIFPL